MSPTCSSISSFYMSLSVEMSLSFCFSSASVQYSDNSLSCFFETGPIKSVNLSRASSTVHGVGKGCFSPLGPSTLASKTNLSYKLNPSLSAACVTSLLVLVGKRAKLLAVLYESPVFLSSKTASRVDPFSVSYLNCCIPFKVTSLPPIYCLIAISYCTFSGLVYSSESSLIILTLRGSLDLSPERAFTVDADFLRLIAACSGVSCSEYTLKISDQRSFFHSSKSSSVEKVSALPSPDL
mmetsp:Transcript_13133/g.9191  ORF Transcript_13133/g.9191 Transcript_13133/m.9191 type:complete len:238 (-) Transcript_13133:618-1331(-)